MHSSWILGKARISENLRFIPFPSVKILMKSAVRYVYILNMGAGCCSWKFPFPFFFFIVSGYHWKGVVLVWFFSFWCFALWSWWLWCTIFHFYTCFLLSLTSVSLTCGPHSWRECFASSLWALLSLSISTFSVLFFHQCREKMPQ